MSRSPGGWAHEVMKKHPMEMVKKILYTAKIIDYQMEDEDMKTSSLWHQCIGWTHRWIKL
jgi:hypothetical protein